MRPTTSLASNDNPEKISPGYLKRIHNAYEARTRLARVVFWRFASAVIDVRLPRLTSLSGRIYHGIRISAIFLKLVFFLDTHTRELPAVSQNISRYIDHTLLKADATFDQIAKLCDEAKEFGFASVCVNPFYVKHCAKLLADSPVKVCTVIGFPLGANATKTKAREARRAIRDGATEIDMVINVGALKSGCDDVVYRDIRAVVKACKKGGAICKCILETALLNDDEKTRACQAAQRARANFVKTSTGFGPGGATVEDVALMSKAVAGTGMGVKASGGIRNLQDAERMIQAGATRLGASAGVQIVQEAQGANPAAATAEKY